MSNKFSNNKKNYEKKYSIDHTLRGHHYLHCIRYHWLLHIYSSRSLPCQYSEWCRNLHSPIPIFQQICTIFPNCLRYFYSPSSSLVKPTPSSINIRRPSSTHTLQQKVTKVEDPYFWSTGGIPLPGICVMDTNKFIEIYTIQMRTWSWSQAVSGPIWRYSSDSCTVRRPTQDYSVYDFGGCVV